MANWPLTRYAKLRVAHAPGIMTSSNRCLFRVTGLLCGELTGLRSIPLKKASDAELWFFYLIYAWTNGWVNNWNAGGLRRHRTHYDVTVLVPGRFSPTSRVGDPDMHHGACASIMPIWSDNVLILLRSWCTVLFKSCLCQSIFLFPWNYLDFCQPIIMLRGLYLLFSMRCEWRQGTDIFINILPICFWIHSIVGNIAQPRKP